MFARADGCRTRTPADDRISASLFPSLSVARVQLPPRTSPRIAAVHPTDGGAHAVCGVFAGGRTRVPPTPRSAARTSAAVCCRRPRRRLPVMSGARAHARAPASAAAELGIEPLSGFAVPCPPPVRPPVLGARRCGLRRYVTSRHVTFQRQQTVAHSFFDRLCRSFGHRR